jgi:intracellular multiplication protein IcmP
MKANSNTKTEDDLLWALGLLFVGVIAAWLIGHEKISGVIMKIRSFEAYLLVFDPEGRDAIRQWIGTIHPKDATLGALWNSGMVAGRTLRWGVLTILTGMFGYLIYKSPDRTSKYARKYTMQTLARQEAQEFPAIQPVLDAGLIDVPLDDPINGMRHRPRDYGRLHGFIVPIAGLGEKDDPAQIEILDSRSALRLDRAREVFAKQLGKVWQGVGELRGYERAIFAACAAQLNNDNKMAQQIIDDLARAYLRARREKKVSMINSLRAQKALHQYGNTTAVKRLVSRNAYKRTVLMTMLTGARESGVLPAAWFRWLKTVDRVTWYALNDLGMEVASAEAAGVRAHWN